MNDTTATSASGASLLPEGTAAITTAHLALIVVLALLVIAGILWGIRLKRTRVQARADVRSNAEESGMPPVEITAESEEKAPAPAPAPTPVPAPAPTPAPTPVPVAPALPPIGDAPVAGAPDRLADEPIAAAAPFDASPATEAVAPAPAPSFADGPVTQLKGLGPKVAGRLGELGVTTVGQMAALDEREAQALDAQLGTFTGRMARDRWIEQARLLAAGDKAGFEAAFGRL